MTKYQDLLSDYKKCDRTQHSSESRSMREIIKEIERDGRSIKEKYGFQGKQGS